MYCFQCCCQDLFRSQDLGLQVLRPRQRPWTSGLETKTLAIRSRDLGLQVSRPRLRPWPSRIKTETEDLDKMNSSLETMVSR